MPCAPLLLRFSDSPCHARAEAGEIKAGLLEVTGASASPNATERVFVRVYRTSSEHFAVLYPARSLVAGGRPLASLNLRSCAVDFRPGGALLVSSRFREGAPLCFRGDPHRMDEWLRAFSDHPQRKKKVSDHRLPLPVLPESEEDDTTNTP